MDGIFRSDRGRDATFWAGICQDVTLVTVLRLLIQQHAG